MTNEEEITAYFDLVYGDEKRGNVALFIKTSSGLNKTIVIPYAQRSIAVQCMLNQSQSSHVYASWALHDDQALAAQTRKQGTALLVPGFGFDVDLALGFHAASNLPATEDEALALLATTRLPPPSFVVHSGGGLYPYWLFDEPFFIENEVDRSSIADLWKAWGQAAAEKWTEAGLQFDTVSELARVFRVPGTLNPKGGEVRPVTVFRPFSGARYSVHELQQIVVSGAERSRPTPGRQPPSGLVRDHLAKERYACDTAEKAAALTGLLSVFIGCRFVAECDRNAEHLTEPAWKDLADVLAHLQEGDDWFHRLSARDQRYDYQETQAKLDRAKDYGPKRCDTIASRCQACGICPFRYNPSVGSPVRLASNSPELVELQRDYILDAKTGLFFDPEAGKDKTKDSFDNSYTQRIEKGTAAAVFKKSKTSLIVDDHDFLIGNPDLIVASGRWRTLNIWKDGGVAAQPGDPSIWIEDHLSYLVPEPEIRRWVLQYLAHLVQKPGTKIRSGILIQSPPGAGKNLFAQLFQKMFHEQDVRVRYGGILGSRWQAPMGNTRLLVLDELQIDELKAAYNVLKPWVTEERADVERKGVDQYSVRTPRGLFIFSHHERPIAIERKDRRLAVVRVEEDKREQAYYDRLGSVGLSAETVGAVKHHLLTLDLTGFDANAEPPMTEAKRDLIRLSGTILEQELETMRALEIFPFDRDLYLVEEVVSAMEARTRSRYTHQKVEAALKSLGDVKLGSRPTLTIGLGKSARRYPWVWRRHEVWRSASEEAVKALFAKSSRVATQSDWNGMIVPSALMETTAQLPN